MTIYWPIGKFILGIYVIFQMSLWMTYQFTTDINAIQEMGQDVLDCHLQQQLPGYSHRSDEAPLSIVDQLPTDQYLSALTSSTPISMIDSNALSSLPPHHRLEVSKFE